MYCTDIYIDSDSFLELSDTSFPSDRAEHYKRIFASSRLILEDNEWTQEILDEALTTLEYQGEEGDEIPKKRINPVLLEDFGINLLHPDKIKLGDSESFYNSLESPFSIFLKNKISKKEIDNLESQHGFKHFTLETFKDFYMKNIWLSNKINKNNSILKIPDMFSKERVLFINSRFFIDNFSQNQKMNREKNPMRDCFSKYIQTFFGNRNKDGFIEICFYSFSLDKVLEKIKSYREVRDKLFKENPDKYTLESQSDVKRLPYPDEVMEGAFGVELNSKNHFLNISNKSNFFDLYAKEGLSFIIDELKKSLIKEGFNNFKITMIRLDPDYYFVNHSRFILTNNLKLAIDRFEKGTRRRCECNKIEGVEFNCLHNNFNSEINIIRKSYSKYKETKNKSHPWDSSLKITSDYKFIELCIQNGVKMKNGAKAENPNYVYRLLNSTS